MGFLPIFLSKLSRKIKFNLICDFFGAVAPYHIGENMGKASFSVEKLTQISQSHINRENGLNYKVVDNSNTNSFNKYYEYDEFLQKAQTRYKEHVKQNMQKSAVENIFQEAIISIDMHHNSNDILDLFFELKQEFGGHELINLTIHKDEGYFTKNNKDFYPHKNILKKDDNNWYITKDGLNGKKDEDFSIKVDISEFSTILTPHAHAIFSMFDFSLGRNARMQKKDMMERLKFVAINLKMDYAPQKIYSAINSDNTFENEEDLKGFDNQIYLQNKNLSYINNQVAKKELELEELNSKLAKQYYILNDIIDKVTKKESELNDLIVQVLTKNDTLDSLSQDIYIKNETINNLSLIIRQKEFKLDEIDNQIYTKTQSIAM
ncbi:hypothetical protein CRU87_02245 [Aliarcobacter trophiarum LMG 25534]|uniref:Uncharacterized protein n=2 Tax=Aliarcobacter trophiarum LMG 25534 TaxID=1032241 RepID=A0ABY0EXX5_9BACT|nr:hypothetical protein CRU87_02245 [Aliarcobacter trophiarum LMG 25534]